MGINVSRFDQMMNGLRIIKIFSVEEEIKGQFVKQNETTRKRYIVRNWIADLSYPISEILLTIIAAVILYVGGFHVLNGESSMNGSVFIFFIVVLISIISPMMETIDEFFCIRQSIACIHRINFVLDHDTSVEECNPSDVKVENITSIVFDNVHFLYEENNPVLKGLSLNINGGQRYAIIGKTGAGKSTMMDILYKFRDVDSGSISINGKNIKDWNVATLRRSLSYVYQQEFLFDDTILYNLTLGDTTYSQHHIDSVTKAIGLFDYISSLPDGYNTKVGDSGICLSGGQRQMVSIARALLKNTSLIILDEATSALDEHTESTVIKGIEKLMSDKTIIIISHHFSAIKDVDRVFVLDDGCIVATGTPQELIGSRFISPQ
jgi:ABC-type multidrug transport system fused ATPase/permease subunit